MTTPQHLPTPALRHVKVGQSISLITRQPGGKRVVEAPRTIEYRDDHYAYFEGGVKASLCHEVAIDQMVFCEGGWRVR